MVGRANEIFDGEAIVMVDAGRRHTACVTAKGILWTWGNGDFGWLGHGNRKPRQRQKPLGKAMYGGSPAVIMASVDNHSLMLMAVSLLWSCGFGYYGQLGHGDMAEKLVLTLVGVEGFRGGQIVMVEASGLHSVAVGAEGQV